MFKLGYVGKAQYLLAKDEPIALSQAKTRFSLDGRYIAEIARQAMIDRYGLSVYKDGFSVYTTIDSRLQEIAEKAVNSHMSNLQEEFFKQNTSDLNPTAPFLDLREGQIDTLINLSAKRCAT